MSWPKDPHCPEPETEQPSIVCPKCKMRSFNIHDIRFLYCGNCHQFHDQMGVIEL